MAVSRSIPWVPPVEGGTEKGYNMAAMAYPQKHKKTAVYYFRRAVPAELREAIGKTEWKESLRTKDLRDPNLVFHSFRHTFKDTCRAADLREEVHDALTGHTGGNSVGRSYGRGMPIERLAEAIKKVEYKGLDLSVVDLNRSP
jgi:integrase